MAPRLQVTTGLKSLDSLAIDRPGLRPVASPVDTFTQTGAGQHLLQLAQGLSSLAPGVAQYADITAKQSSEKDKAQGQADAREYAASGKSYSDAQRDGKISSADNPWYRLGFKEAIGQVHAYKFGSDFQKEVQNKLADATDTADFDAVAGNFRADWLKKNGASAQDLGFSNGFGPLADSIVANARSAFVAAADGKMRQQSYEAHTAAMTATIDHELDAGTPEPARIESIHMMLGRALASGMDNVTANNAAIAAITNAAIARGDSSILDMMKGIGAGPTALFDRPSARDAYHKALTIIAGEKQSAWGIAREHVAAERTDRVRTAYTTASQSLYDAGKDAGGVDISEAIKTLNADDPGAAANLTDLKKSVVANAYNGNPATFNQEYSNLLLIRDPSNPHFLTEQHVGALVTNRELSVQQASDLIHTMKVLREKPRADVDPLNVFDRAYSQLSGSYGGEMNMVGEVALNRQAALQYVTQHRIAADADGSWNSMTASQRQTTVDTWVTEAQKRWRGPLGDVREQFRSSPTSVMDSVTAMRPVVSDGARRKPATAALKDAESELKARFLREYNSGSVSAKTVQEMHARGYATLDAAERWAKTK